MTAAVNHMPDADADDDQQRAREQVGGNHECDAGVMNAAHVDEGENRQHAEAQLQRVRLQAWRGGDERAHAGRDAYGGRERVVDHQGSGGQQARSLAEVLAGNGI